MGLDSSGSPIVQQNSKLPCHWLESKRGVLKWVVKVGIGENQGNEFVAQTLQLYGGRGRSVRGGDILPLASQLDTVPIPAVTVAHFVGHHRGGHGEFHGGAVDDAHHVATSGGLDDGEEGAVHAVFGVELQHLLVVVGALQELNAGVEGAAVGAEQDGDTVHIGVEGVGAEGPTLNGLALGILNNFKASIAGFLVGSNASGQRELEVSRVADGNGVGAARGVDESAEGTGRTVLDVDLHLVGSVVRSLPELNIGIQRAAISLQEHVNTFDGGVGKRPRAERATLDGSLLGGFPDFVDALGAGTEAAGRRDGPSASSGDGAGALNGGETALQVLLLLCQGSQTCLQGLLQSFL